MSAVVDDGSNSRFFRRPWAGREGLWPELVTLASYSCEKTNRSVSDMCGHCGLDELRILYGLNVLWTESQACERWTWEYGGRWQACEDRGVLRPEWSTWRERLVMWKLSVCSYEEVWGHLNISKPCAVLRNYIKATSRCKGVFLRTVSMAGTVPLPVPSTAQAQTSKTKALTLYLRSCFRCHWIYCEWRPFSKKCGWRKEIVREDQLVFNVQFSRLMSKVDNLGFILRAANLNIQT